jgi:hypothetical protein
LFKGLGVLLALYVVYGLTVGVVYAKRGPGGAAVKRAEDPFNYWAAVDVYSGLSLALIFLF